MAFSTGLLFLDLFGIITAIIAVGYVYFKWAFQYWKKRNVPYLEPTIPFGTFSSSPFSRTLSIGDIFKEMYKKVKAKGWKHCGLYSFTTPSYFVMDLDLVKNIMAKDFQYFTDRGNFTNEKADPIGSHLFNLGGTKWKNLRAKLTPTFTSGKMKAMFPTLVDCGLVLEKYFEETTDSKEAVDIKDVLGRYSTDIIGSCAFGLECNSFKEPNSLFRVYGKKIFEVGTSAIFKRVITRNYPSLARKIGLRTVPKDVSDFFTKVVSDTVDYREKNNVVRKDFLQLLIEMKNNKDNESDYKGDGKTLNMNEIVAQSFVFFLAGFETSSTTITFALFELATHPEIQKKVREEINTVLAKHDNQITYDSLNELKYMGQVIDETLRLFPPLPLLTRECVEDYKVPGEDVIIEKGTQVMIPVSGIHYDEDYYENPEVFDPERFNDENKKSRNQYAHLPFGEGARICIGLRFGIMETKIGLTCILRKFNVKLNEKTQIPLKMARRSFISTAEGGIWLNVERI